MTYQYHVYMPLGVMTANYFYSSALGLGLDAYDFSSGYFWPGVKVSCFTFVGCAIGEVSS